MNSKVFLYSIVLAWLMLLAVLVVAGCRSARGYRLEDIPTLVPDINVFATQQIQTRNAPPEDYRESVSFPQIDANLSSLPGWRYVVTFEFRGTFNQTPRETSANANAEVWFNQLGSARRIVFSTSGELLGQNETEDWEAVRLGPDAYLVQDNICMSNVEDDAATAADLSAGELIGGVEHATPYGRREVINGAEVYLYSFALDDITLPAVEIVDGGTMTGSGELWVAPEHDAVMRYYLTLDVTNARIFGRSLPVDGRILARYDLFEVGTMFNIAQPFGC
jgi:hypothetical protein